MNDFKGVKRRNWVARKLRCLSLKPRVVKSKKLYSRKAKHKEPNREPSASTP